MKLIIDIDKSVYSLCQIVASNENEYVSALENAIKNGIPITDGDLISRSALKIELINQIAYFRDRADTTNIVIDKRKYGYFADGLERAKNTINNAPTIGDTEEWTTSDL